MDQNANLREQLQLARRLVNGGDWIDLADATPAEIAKAESMVVDAARLSELVLALHQWIMKSGCLPRMWQGAINMADFEKMCREIGGEGG